MNTPNYKTIGFFGDSFCATTSSLHSLMNGYTTYINKLVNHYGVDIVNLGHGGSSVWDVVLTQLQPLIDANSIPDICVFVWTDPSRLYHKSVRNINCVSSEGTHLLDRSVWRAAKQYYRQLHDYEQTKLAYTSLLQYVDNNILSALPTTTKVVHLWSFGNPASWDNIGFLSNNITYPHTWKHGVEIRPALASISLSDRSFEVLAHDKSANHLEGNTKNDIVFEWIRNAIDV